MICTMANNAFEWDVEEKGRSPSSRSYHSICMITVRIVSGVQTDSRSKNLLNTSQRLNRWNRLSRGYRAAGKYLKLHSGSPLNITVTLPGTTSLCSCVLFTDEDRKLLWNLQRCCSSPLKYKVPAEAFLIYAQASTVLWNTLKAYAYQQYRLVTPKSVSSTTIASHNKDSSDWNDYGDGNCVIYSLHVLTINTSHNIRTL